MKLALDRVSAVPRSQLEFSALVALGASGWLSLLLVVTGAPVPLRILASFGFVSFCPGLALLSHLKRLGPVERGVLGVALSVSLATLLSEAMALFAVWSATGALAGLALLCSAAVAVRLWKLRHPQSRLLNWDLPRSLLPTWRRPHLRLPDVHLPDWHLPEVHLPDWHLPQLRLPRRRPPDLRLLYWRLQIRLFSWEPPQLRLPRWGHPHRSPPHRSPPHPTPRRSPPRAGPPQRSGRKANAGKPPLRAARHLNRWTRPARSPLSWWKALWPASRWRS